MAQTRYLDYHLPKRLLNAVFARSLGGDDRPVFHDIAATAPSVAAVTASYRVRWIASPTYGRRMAARVRHPGEPARPAADSYALSSTARPSNG